ncbi:porin [Caballeronia sp. 15711]|uniref:porin n=1 Tax=Caballeronia sp. 15711 TaxID=3391029 RepID=UPI0039E70367
MSIRPIFPLSALTCAALACSPLVHAQSSVMLYGVADASVVWQTHADSQGDHAVLVSNGAINHSRFGLIGNEDLGGGTSAFFQLESGFNLQDGTMAAPGTVFDRMAIVGLKGNFGSLSVGNQDTQFYSIMGALDPLTVGDYYDTAWWYATDTFRKPSSVNYTKQFGPLTASLSYAFGRIAGSVARGSQWGSGLTYAQGAFSLAAVYQQTKAAVSGGLQQIFGVASSYKYGDATFYAGYQNNHDNADIGDAQLNIAGAPYGTANVARKDQGAFAGVAWQLTPYVLLREAYYYDDIHDAMKISGNDGVRWAAVSEAEYSFSKRSSVYAQVDYNHTSGAARVQLPYSNNQTEFAVGMRHWF